MPRLSPDTVTLDGHAHRYYTAHPLRRAGHPVVALHGFGTDARATFQPAAKPLIDRGVSLYAPDLLGFGRSAKPDIAYSLHRYAALCVAFADRMALEAPVLLGHSMGGKIAAATMALHPRRFAGLVLVAPGGFSWMAPWVPSVASSNWANALLQNAWFQQTVLPLFPGGRLLARPQSLRQLQRLRHSHYALDLDATGLRDQLGDINRPAQLIWGDDDAILPDATVARIRRQVPGLTVRRFHDAGHFVMRDRPKAFADAVQDFAGTLAERGDSLP